MENSLDHRQFEKPGDDYLRVMTASPEVAIGDPVQNAEAILSAYRAAKDQQTELIVLPELCITGYSAADLFLNQHVLRNAEVALTDLAKATVGGPAMAVGIPLAKDGLLFNCAALLAEGKIAGIVPKSFLPNYNEFYEKRWFSSGRNVNGQTLEIDSEIVPFGTDLLFDINGTKVGIEICEDAWAPIPPSTQAALAGAEVIVNLSASNELVGKAEYRRDMICGLAGRLLCAYVYTSAGEGESDADIVYGGHQIISENGRLAHEAKPLLGAKESLIYDIDRAELVHDRLVNKTFADQALEQDRYRVVKIAAPRPKDKKLHRSIDAHPFVPKNPETLNERCEQIMHMMATSLARRIRDKNSGGVVIGLSGGLDSTLTLLAAEEACDILGVPTSFIHTITMPASASSERTQDNASLLAKALGTTHSVIPIDQLSNLFLQNIGHDQTTEDITYENTQARTRTEILMNYANKINGLVAGTGDMSENAQGWCTYNGDHMSMYNVNTTVPKTLVKHLVRWFADTLAGPSTKKVLRDILDTPVSPELTGNGDLSQTTEDILGPYELHDFFLYHLARRGAAPDKIGYLATLAFEGKYTKPIVAQWLGSFLGRFTGSQWKREVMPNGPKIGTVSLSPRGDWRMAPNTSSKWFK